MLVQSSSAQPGQSTATAAATTSATVALASPAAAGRSLVCLVVVDKSAGAFTTPAGWTALYAAVGASVSLGVFVKTAAGGEQSLTVSWSTAVFSATLFLAEVNAALPTAARVGTYDSAETTVTSAALALPAALDVPAYVLAALALDSVGSNTANSAAPYTATNGYAKVAELPLSGFTDNGHPGLAVFDATLAAGSTGATTLATAGWSDQAKAVVLAFASVVAVRWALPGVPDAATLRGSVALDVPGATSPAVRLVASPAADLSTGRVFSPSATLTAAGGYRGAFAISGLAADTPYYVGVEVDGVIQTAAAARFTARTSAAGRKAFRLLASSCDHEESNTDMFPRLGGAGGDLFLHMGDWHYADITTNDVTLFRSAWDNRIAAYGARSPVADARSAAYRARAMAYIWDDHDFGANNSSSDSPSRPAARQHIREAFAAPFVQGAGGAAYYSFVYHGLRFVVTDARSERTPYTATDDANKTVLGSTQKAWFKQELLNARAARQPVVWVMSFPWIGTTGDDGWYLYTVERAELSTFIAANGLGNALLMISGDMHGLAADDGTNSDYSGTGNARFRVIQAAALTSNASTKGGPYSQGTSPGSGRYGIVDFAPAASGDGVSFTFAGRKEADAADITLAGVLAYPVAPTGLMLGAAQTVVLRTGQTLALGPAVQGPSGVSQAVDYVIAPAGGATVNGANVLTPAAQTAADQIVTVDASPRGYPALGTRCTLVIPALGGSGATPAPRWSHR